MNHRKFTAEQEQWLNEFLKDHSVTETVKAFNENNELQIAPYHIYGYVRRHSVEFKQVSPRRDEEQCEWLKANCNKYSMPNLVTAYNEKFGTDVDYYNIWNFCKDNGLKTKDNDDFYTEAELNWIKTHDFENTTDRYIEFTKEFGNHHTQCGLDSFCKKNGVRVTGEYRFYKGQQTNAFPIGTEKVIDGFTCVKINNLSYVGTCKNSANWKMKHYLIWEQAYGEVPKDCVLIFADGDRTNFDLDNLVLMPVKYRILMTRWNDWCNKGELTKTALKWCDLHYAIKEAGEENENRKGN